MQIELKAAVDDFLAASGRRRGSDGLDPCPRPPVPVPLPEKLPNAIVALIAKTRSDLDALFAKSNVTGGVATLVYGDRVLLTHSYGSTRRPGDASGSAPDESTLFRIGSISKVFTDTILYQQHENGAVSLDDPIEKLAPDYAPAWPRGKTPTPRGGTLRDLGSHMAGLARYMPCTFGATCNISVDTAVERISHNWTLLYEPGSRLAYSNTGFSLLGQLLARKAGVTYEALLAALAADLELSSTSTLPPDDLSKVAFGYQAGGTRVPLLDLGITNPAGGIYSTAADMAKVLSFLLRDGAMRGSGQPLDSATVRSWLNTRVWQNPSTLPDGIWYTDWGVPWQILTANLEGVPALSNFSRYYLISKDGSIPGYNSQMVLQPDLKLGLFASMTTGEGRSVPFFSDVLVELGLKLVPSVLAYLTSVQPTKLPPAPADYLGTYYSEAFGGRLEVGLDPTGPFGKSTLILRSNNLGWPESQPIAWVRDDTFEMLPLPDALCWTIEGGNNYVMHFSREASSTADPVVAVSIEGITVYPAVLVKQ